MHLHLLLICFQGPAGETTSGVSVTGGSSPGGTVTSPEGTTSTGASAASTQTTGTVSTISLLRQPYKIMNT